MTTTQQYKEISTTLYGGKQLFGKGRDPYEQYTVLCSTSETCPLYANNQCLMARRLGFISCMFGKTNLKRGTGPRAKSYYDLKTETEQKETYAKLRSANTRFFAINDHYFLSLEYIDIWYNNENSTYSFRSPYSSPYSDYATQETRNKWKNHGSSHFFKKDQLTADMLQSLLNYHPQALFGGEIAVYQKEIVPQLKAEILQYAPDLAKELEIEDINYVGMLGLLSTLIPPFDLSINGIPCHYDGEFVTTESPKVIDLHTASETWRSAIGDIAEVNVKYKPFDSLYIEIKDNSWVGKNSVVKSKR